MHSDSRNSSVGKLSYIAESWFDLVCQWSQLHQFKSHKANKIHKANKFDKAYKANKFCDSDQFHTIECVKISQVSQA